MRHVHVQSRSASRQIQGYPEHGLSRSDQHQYDQCVTLPYAHGHGCHEVFFLARPVEVGAWILINGAVVAGQETHGKFLGYKEIIGYGVTVPLAYSHRSNSQGKMQ